MSFNTKAMQEALPSKQRPGKTYEDVCREYLSEVKIPEGDVKIENRPAPSPQRDSEVMVKTNMFRSVVKKVIPIYQYSVKMEGRRSDLSEWSVISEGSANDYFNMERREACRHLYVTARLYITDFEKAESHFYYDGRSTLYSVKKTNKPSISLKLTREQVVAGAALDPTKVADMVVLRGYNEFMVEITNVGDNGAENFSTDISTLLADENMELSNPQFVRFLDIATSQYVMDDRENHISFPNGISYFADPEQSGYNVDQLQQEHGIYFAPGISKSARLIRGQNDKVESAIVVQPKLSPFHNVESVVEKVGNLIDERSILPIVLGLYVYPVHLFYRETRPILRPFKITGLGPSANNIKFEYDGQTITVAKYFEKVHGRRLEFPHLPTVECKQQDKNRIYYPMEVCEILDNQRSSSSQVIDQLVKLAAIAPNVLDGRIRRCAEALNMNNEYMENAQIKVEENPIEIKAPLLPTPTLVYASKNSEFETDATRLTWQTGDYVKTP
ncbi:hypothetical protein M3Y94_00990500 [Aphelenchoides besseyi]|nr:hypothetical protein M3Y94_00990500 [Aphelenchoides besseyi]